MIDATDPLGPPHPTMVAYRRAFDAALRGNPKRAARLAALEAASRAAETGEAFRENGLKIVALIREVEDELAPDWPQVWCSGKDEPPGSGHSAEGAGGAPRGQGAPVRNDQK